MKVTFLGHASLCIETLGKTIVVDPFISPNPQASDVDVDGIEADYILITHAHQDHIVDVERIAENTDAIIVSNFEIVSHYSEKGLSGHGMNHGGQFKGDFGTIKMVNAIHSSSFPDGKYGGNPAGFVIHNEEVCIYIAGDTCVTMDMKLIPSMGYKVDLAILPIGDTFTMGYQEASMAADLVECTRVLGCHYDTFPPIKIDHEQAKMYFKDKGQELILLPIGDQITV